MTQPDALKTTEPLLWSPGTGVEVWQMLSAAAAGDLPAIERLVNRNPALVRCNYAYRTPLYFAVRENRLDVARFLIARCADPLGFVVHDTLVEIARRRGYDELASFLAETLERRFNASPKGNAVAAAIRDRDAARVRALLHASPDLLHAGDERSCQPIHWAVMSRQIPLIDELLARGADINARRADGARPIQLSNGDYLYRGWRDVPKDDTTTPREVLDHLRARGADVDICTASYIGDIARVRGILARDPSLANKPDAYVTYYPCSGTPLRNAAAAGHIEIVRLLLDHGADPNLPEEGIAPRGHALYAAVASGHVEIARLLLDRGAYPNPPVESSADALSRAISSNHHELIDLLCSHGAARSLEIVAYYGDVQTAAAMLFANPALADDTSALKYAAEEGHEPIVRLLLRFRPDLSSRIGIVAKTPELTNLLFDHGMNPSHPDWLGVTPLHEIARKGDLQNADLFLARGANLHAIDDDLGLTPRGWAERSGQSNIASRLSVT